MTSPPWDLIWLTALPSKHPLLVNCLSSQTGLVQASFLGAAFLYKRKYCAVLVHFVLPVLCKLTLILDILVGGGLG